MAMLGANGRGVYEHFDLMGDTLFYGGTLSKAFGGFGGIIPGPASFIKSVMNGPVVGGSSSVPPPLAAGTRYCNPAQPLFWRG